MRITDEEARQLQALRARRDHAAMLIGVATHEWRQAVARAEEIVTESETVERDLGPQILRAHGLDPEAADYRIQPDGQIVQLAAGQYIEVT